MFMLSVLVSKTDSSCSSIGSVASIVEHGNCSAKIHELCKYFLRTAFNIIRSSRIGSHCPLFDSVLSINQQ